VQTLAGVPRSRANYFAIETMAGELAAAQVTARKLVPAGSIQTVVKRELKSKAARGVPRYALSGRDALDQT
jgi:hypothetical protein